SGAQVVLGQEIGRVWQRDNADSAWVEATVTLTGQPYDVHADPHQPGRFVLADAGAGVLVSDDSGATWDRVFHTPARVLAFDVAKPGRIGAVLANDAGVALSEDGGATWRMLSNEIPNRHLNAIAFTDDRLMVGTAGNGVFWIGLADR
ncbi:MAG: hypothetical protein AAF078_04985, partial [Planctomycetota bacterium]